MSRQLPPSPNWYSSSCCDWSAGGLVAYAAKSAVRFLDPSTRRIVGELLGHDDRVTTLTFVRSPPWLHVCVTGSADKTVRAWDSESSSCMSCLRDQHQLEVVAVASSAAMGPLILSVDKGGVLVAWDFASSSSRSACPMKMPATCMASTGARTAAVGYANGVILLLDVTTISILHKLVGHDGDVQSLDWAPPPPAAAAAQAQPSGTDHEELPELASAGRDRTIRVWNARVGTSKQVLKPKAAPGEAKNRGWLACKWHPQEKDSLISGGSNGDVWWWNVKSKRAQKGTGKQLPSRSVFSFALGRLAGDEEEKLKMVCVSMDRTIALWDMQDSLTCRWLLPCLGGYVYDIDRCPSDPARVVLAVGDQTIRTWQTNSREPHDCQLLWRGLQAKVICVRWHPDEDGTVAFGTDDGRVGMCDVMSQKHRILAGRHAGSVYELGWWSLGVGEEGACLCSCGADGKMLLRRSRWGGEGGEGESFIDLAKKLRGGEGSRAKVSDFHLARNGRKLLVGRADGGLEGYELQHDQREEGGRREEVMEGWSWGLLFENRLHTMLINRVRWHIHADWREVFASASDDGDVRIVDTGGDGERALGAGEVTLRGHRKPVAGLDWCPHAHRASWIASSSFDFTAQVWDVLARTPLFSLRGHDGRVFSACWIPAGKLGDSWDRAQLEDSWGDPLLVTGSDDQSARIWEVEKCWEGGPPSKSETSETKMAIVMKQRKQTWKNEKKLKAKGAEAPQTTSGETGGEKEEKTTKKKKEEEKRSTKEDGEGDARSASMDREGIISKGSRSKKIESLLSTQAKAANLAAEQRWVGATTQLVDDLLAIPCPGEENLLPPPPSPPRPFKFDASQTEHELTRLLISTARQHAAAGEHNKSACLGLFRGDIAEALATAAERGALTSELVSLAPLAGHDVWSAASRLLAKQLEAQQLPHQAVAHLLACNQVEDAVAVYRRAGMYRDAIALARCRFSSSQLVLQQLWSDWAQALQAAHRPIYAAQCFLRAGRASEAIAVLEQGGGPRGSEPSMLLAAHKLSEKFGARSEARTLRCAGLLWEVGMLEEAGEVSCSLAGCSSLRLLVALELRVMPQPLAELSVLHRLRLLLPHPSDQLVRLAEGGWGGSGCEEENNGVLAGILLEAATSLDGGEGEEGRNRRERAERLLEDVQRGEWVRSLRGGMEEILTRRQQARAARSFLLAVLLGFCGKREKAGQELAVALSQLFALKDYMAAAELAVALLPDDCGGLERMGGEEEEGDAKPMREREGREGKVLQVLQAFRWFGEVYMACNGTGRKEVGKERQRLDRLQEMRAKLVGTSRHNQVEQALSSLPSVVTWLLPPPRCISFSDPESIIQAPAPSICSQLLADLDQLNVEERTLQ